MTSKDFLLIADTLTARERQLAHRALCIWRDGLRADAAKRKRETDRDLPLMLAAEAQALIDKLGPTD